MAAAHDGLLRSQATRLAGTISGSLVSISVRR